MPDLARAFPSTGTRASLRLMLPNDNALWNCFGLWPRAGSRRTLRQDSTYIVSESSPDSASTARRRSLWVSRDTTMRNLRQPRTNLKHRSDLPLDAKPQGAAPVSRLFSPSELDLDDLEEAIRSLLGPTIVPQRVSPCCPDPDLLLVRPRVSHVVEATEAA